MDNGAPASETPDTNNNNNHNINNSKPTEAKGNNANRSQTTLKGSGHNSSSITMNNTANEDEIVEGGDDVGWWDCSLCTYRNSADKFKCDICDLRRGTSTRKPRNNAETIVAQVLKQQEQIRQQTVVKTPKSKPVKPVGATVGAADPEAASSSKPPRSASGKKKSTTNDGIESSGPSEHKKRKAKKKSSAMQVDEGHDASESDGAESTGSDSTEADDQQLNIGALVMDSDSESEPFSSSSRASSPEVEANSSSPVPLKITPIEVNGNLIKYSAPTSRGRTGLIIDKKRFSQHSVTINDVTVTFTEFATRQNRYIRKKKRSRTNNGKSSVKTATTNNST